MKVLLFGLIMNAIFCNSPMSINPAFDSYNDLFTRGAKNPGFWGAVGPSNANVFNDQWNSNGYQQMYNLNSQSPMAGSRGNGFDTTTTMFNQYGPNSFEVIPVQSNFMPQSRINAYTYDLNEPRMAAIYKNYMRFMNKNLDRLTNVVKGNTDFNDLNNNAIRKLKNPASFQYKTEYFDGLDLKNTMPEYYHQKIQFQPQKTNESSERLLRQTPSIDDSIDNVSKIKKLKNDLHHIEKKLEILENLAVENDSNTNNFVKV